MESHLEALEARASEGAENSAVRRLRDGCLLAVVVLEAFYFLLETRGNGVACTWIEVYAVIPTMLFLGTPVSGRLSRHAGRLLRISVGMIVWLFLAHTLRRIDGGDKQNIGAFVCAYGLCLPFAGVSRDGKRRLGLKLFLGLYMGLGVLMMVYGGMLLTGSVPAYLREYVRWDGTRLLEFLHPNFCATYFMISIFACLVCCLKTKKHWLRGVLIVWAGAQFAMMALTNGRTTIAFTCFLVGACLFFVWKKAGWKRMAIAALAAVAVMAGLFVGSQKITGFHKTEAAAVQTETKRNNPQGSWDHDLKSLNGRTEIWSSAAKGLRDNPKIYLEGTDYTGLILSQYNRFAVQHTHNSWLETLYQLGLPALLGALALTVLALYDAAAVLRRSTDPVQSCTAILVLCLLGCAVLEPYLFTGDLGYHAPNFLFMLCLGYLDTWRAALRGEE